MASTSSNHSLQQWLIRWRSLTTGTIFWRVLVLCIVFFAVHVLTCSRIYSLCVRIHLLTNQTMHESVRTCLHGTSVSLSQYVLCIVCTSSFCIASQPVRKPLRTWDGMCASTRPHLRERVGHQTCVCLLHVFAHAPFNHISP